MLIGELAGTLGLNPRTVRYYERIGLLPQPERSSTGYRVYSTEDVDRLRFVRTAQRLGLTLDEIREILAFAERGEPPCGYVRQVLDHEVTAIDDRIAELRRLRDQLVTLNTRAERLPASTDGCYCHIIHAAEDAGAVLDQKPVQPASR